MAVTLTTLTKVGAFDNDSLNTINTNEAALATAVNAVTAVNPVGGVATGYKVARGVTALDGSNPTPVTTGLTTIVGLALALNRSTSLATGTAFVTYNNISGGSFDIYAWVVAGTASTGTENVAWVAVGT